MPSGQETLAQAEARLMSFSWDSCWGNLGLHPLGAAWNLQLATRAHQKSAENTTWYDINWTNCLTNANRWFAISIFALMKMDFSFNLYEPLWKPCYWEVYDCSHELVTPIVPLVMVSVPLNGSGWAPSRVLSLFGFFSKYIWVKGLTKIFVTLSLKCDICWLFVGVSLYLYQLSYLPLVMETYSNEPQNNWMN